jgi:hypothetical protein
MRSSLNLTKKRKISKKLMRSTSTKSKKMKTSPNLGKRRKTRTCFRQTSSRTPLLPKKTMNPPALLTKKRRRRKSPKMSLTQS